MYHVLVFTSVCLYTSPCSFSFAEIMCKNNLKVFIRCFLTACLQRVHLNIDVGEHANDYKQIQAKEKLSELQLRVRQLLEQVDQITKEQNYQRVCF